MLSKEELLSKWKLAFLQYQTIDKNKCEQFGTLYQGFFALRRIIDGKEMCEICQFNFHNALTLHNIEEFISELETNFFGISFVQNYIHYT